MSLKTIKLKTAALGGIKMAIKTLARHAKESGPEAYRNLSVSEIESRFLFRGQCDSKWKLQTSLDREGRGIVDLGHYWEFACDIAASMKNRAGVSRLPKATRDNTNSSFIHYHLARNRMLPNQALLCYLRHHGFPSPLLDWTESRYVALFFAYSEMRAGTSEVSIYVHLPALIDPSKRQDFKIPVSCALDQRHNPTERHAAQKCVQTVAVVVRGRRAYNVPHIKAGRLSYLAKITLPGSCRKSVLRELSGMNISHYDLFGGADHLARDLWLSESPNLRVLSLAVLNSERADGDSAYSS
jgi:hypothetical protein